MIVLVGERGEKRTEFFMRAAEDCGVHVRLLEWGNVFAENYELPQPWDVVKIDPPSYRTMSLNDMAVFLKHYCSLLRQFSLWPCKFLNTPREILSALDKRAAKKRLIKCGIESTEWLFTQQNDVFSDPQQLFVHMKSERISSVFLKPAMFSGAAGVAALRLQWGHAGGGSRKKLYTSCLLEDGKLFNTKKMRAIEQEDKLLLLLTKLLSLEPIIERWHPKDSIHGKVYDLRAVCQFGRVEYIIMRCANGPITNLHLNNQAVNIREAGFTEEKLQEIEDLCRRTMRVFPELSVAGLDILIEKDTKRPLIIELNGQGDCIYQDIYADNKIYHRQIEYLRDHYL